MPPFARSVPPPIALLLLYATSGLLWGSWIQRLPAVTRHLDLTQSQLGMVLPAFPIGALIAFQLVSAWSTRVQSRTILTGFGLLRAAVFPLLGLATDMPTLMAALTLSGFAHGGLEVALNSQGLEIERQLHRPILARGAAANSIGMLASGGVIWLVVRDEVPWVAPFVVAAVAGLAMFLVFGRFLIRDQVTSRQAAPMETGLKTRWVPPPALWLVLVFAFIFEVLDETMSEWVGIYLDDDLASGPAISSLDYSLYTAALLAGRLVGDTVSRYVPPMRILQVAGVVGGVGMLFGTSVNTQNAILLGSGVIGLGTSLVLPTIFRLAGSTPDLPTTQALAMTSTTIYLGYMVGPMVIGPISGAISLRAALVLVAVLCLSVPAIAWLSRATRFAPAKGSLSRDAVA